MRTIPMDALGTPPAKRKGHTMKNEQSFTLEKGAPKLSESRSEAAMENTSELERLEDLWNLENEDFTTSERIAKRKEKVRLPVSAHGRRGRPSRETDKSSRVRHRISQQGGMHKRRRKQVK